jgi:hypothetical protein
MTITNERLTLTDLVVIDPRSGVLPTAVEKSVKGEAPRVDTLDGKTLAFINNGMGSARILEAALLKRLRARYNLKDVIQIQKPSVSVPPNPEDWQEVVSRADVGITLFGGCGSCTSRTTRDAIEMEWAGIPAVPIVHEALFGSAEAIRKMSKMPDYPVVKVGYPAAPTAVWADDLLEKVLDLIEPQVLARLLVGAAR